ncbi:MAG: 2-amino-4-hydroxy-6-hydroxymethyldihydropteridine diphosphokinase [Chelatococcus sp.]|uniref:2-amino-4-hydroxy-6- hydroxymethyldihydropteridine diphosphokinase n=1 Tax=Chelatococcus sp. TaxID=1953771 RepID=UPI0025BC6FC9|nr:2-amino-4-hydroxy-6-hydroxymethyldihydropteridine diphosphokinase [Chelatococcus sp.]MBX3539705.1 2-amino-4-hydroxy-6-hydroxymethyldihydropteridine diphosphokinase [Chelatococcus sp.]
MAEAYICLGSNLGDKRATIAQALDRLARAADIVVKARSGDYRTPPWGKLDQDWFVNACACIETPLTPEALLAQCLDVERQLGRERRERWGPRVIDIDLLTYDDRAMATESLTLPHPHLTQRAFVLVPLAEIAPTLEINGRSVADWLAALDFAGIERMAP